MKISEDRLRASILRDSYEEFLRAFWHVVNPEKLQWNWHMGYLCNEVQTGLERIFRGEPKLYDEVTNISPGTSKSTIYSVFLTPWAWTRMPSFKNIGASYAHPLALDLSRKARDVVESDLYRKLFPEVQLRSDQSAKGYFMNTKGGYRYAVGSGGSVTGMHAHLIVIDDPLDPNEAASDVEIESTNHWIQHTLRDRKVDKAITPMWLVMQRLHQNDPTALFLKRKRLKHNCIPARLSSKTSPELRKYYVNNLMDPRRLSEDILREAEEEMGPYGFAGQHMQDPVPEGGGMFKTDRLNVGQAPDRLKHIVRFWDKAGSKGKGAFTVGIKLGLGFDNHLYIMHVIRQQMDSYQRERLIRQTARFDGRGVIIGLEEEPGSGGMESAENTVRRLLGFRVRIIKPRGDKALRADPVSVQVNSGNVTIVPGGWNDDFIEEMKYFPFSTYMDQMDALSGGFSVISKNKKRIGGMIEN